MLVHYDELTLKFELGCSNWRDQSNWDIISRRTKYINMARMSVSFLSFSNVSLYMELPDTAYNNYLWNSLSYKLNLFCVFSHSNLSLCRHWQVMPADSIHSNRNNMRLIITWRMDSMHQLLICNRPLTLELNGTYDHFDVGEIDNRCVGLLGPIYSFSICLLLQRPVFKVHRYYMVPRFFWKLVSLKDSFRPCPASSSLFKNQHRIPPVIRASTWFIL